VLWWQHFFTYNVDLERHKNEALSESLQRNHVSATGRRFRRFSVADVPRRMNISPRHSRWKNISDK
jgi:hypothetical protein